MALRTHWHPHTGKDSQLLTHSSPQILLKGKHVLSVSLFLVLTGNNSLTDRLSLEILKKSYHRKEASSSWGTGRGSIEQDASLNPLPVLISTLVKLASHLCEQALCHPTPWVLGWAAKRSCACTNCGQEGHKSKPRNVDATAWLELLHSFNT